MTSTLRRASLAFSLLAFAVVAAPAILTAPFNAQTDTHLTWAYWLARLGLPIAVIALVVALFAVAWSWRSSSGFVGRAARILAVLLAGAALWLSTANVAQWMFRPLGESRYVRLAEVEYLDADDLVLGVHRDGQALIYPVDIVGYHHILNERLTGEPFVVTY